MVLDRFSITIGTTTMTTYARYGLQAKSPVSHLQPRTDYLTVNVRTEDALHLWFFLTPETLRLQTDMIGRGK